MDDLTAFVLAQLDAVERAASSATPGPWRHDPSKHHRMPGTVMFSEAVFAGAAGSDATCIAETGEPDDPQSMRDAEHIALHDPARELAEVQVKRLIVDLHPHQRFTEPLDAESRFEEDHRPAFEDDPKYVGCQRCDYDPRDEEVTPNWWCLTLRLLALPYAGREGYREEWAPAE